MSDPYYLRKANIDELDLSNYEKEYSPEELAQVKESLRLAQQQHQQEFDKLPLAERAKYHASDLIDYVEQNPETILGVPAAAALFGAGKVAAEKGSETANKIHGSLRDFMASKSGNEGLLATQRAEKAAQAAGTPTEVSAKAVPSTNVDVTQEVGKGLNPTDTELLKKSESIPAKKEVSGKLAAAKKAMEEGIAAGLPETTLTTGTGKSAYAGQADTTKFRSVYPNVESVPKGYAFVPGAQNIDTVRGNVGQPTFTKEFAVRPYPKDYQEALSVSNEINRGMNRPTRAQLIAEGKPLPENTKGITREVSKSKFVKVAGVGGALIALSDLANAKTATEAGLRAADIATDYVPLVSQIKQSLTPLEAGMSRQEEESIIANKFKEAQKLGSPYRSVPPPKR